MPHVKKAALLVLMITALMPVLAFGLDTRPYGPNCLRSGTPCVLSGTQFTAAGTVDSFVRGGGLELMSGTLTIGETSTTGEAITVYGIGPERFWDGQEIAYPAVGDIITATGYICPTTGHYIAFSIIIEDVTVQLRDPDTGRPLWRRGTAGRGW